MAKSFFDTSLAGYTTLRVGGPASEIREDLTRDELVAAIVEADSQRRPVLVLGGGSNIVIGDNGFSGLVAAVSHKGIKAVESEQAVLIRVQAGEVWDEFVEFCVSKNYAGIEALSGIPGLVGATPVQNVGAYGQEVSTSIVSVEAFDRSTGEIAEISAAECLFTYRSSRFKMDPTRYVVLAVTFLLRRATHVPTPPYPDVTAVLGDGPVPLQAVRDTVIAVRRSKGMVLDDSDHDTWSAGSFFTNPVVSQQDLEKVPSDAPQWPQGDGTVKVSAAWLIEHAGFGKGCRLSPEAAASLSSKHTLALTNRGGASATDILDLAHAIIDGVHERFGITLVPEPVVI